MGRRNLPLKLRNLVSIETNIAMTRVKEIDA